MKKVGTDTRAGFTLIELIIAIALSSIVSVVLINALYQMSRFTIMIDERVYVYSHAAIIQQQMERDITAAFIPDVIKTSTNYRAQTGARQAGAGKAESGKGETQEQTPNSAEQGESGQKDAGPKKLFYGVSNGENFDLLSCITTSPLPVYWGTKSGKPRARIARVIYRLERDPERPDSYILYREEGADLDFASYQKEEGRFVLAKDIKSMTVRYEAEIRKKERDQDKKSLAGSAPAAAQTAGAEQSTEKGEHESAPEYKLFLAWDSDTLAKTKGREADSAQSLATEDLAKSQSDGGTDLEKSGVSSRTPHSVIIELRLWNPEHTHDRLFKFAYPVVWQDRKNKASSLASSDSAPSDSAAQAAEQASTNSPSSGATGSPTAASAAPNPVSGAAKNSRKIENKK